MKNTTRLQYNRYLENIAKLNGVQDATKNFSVEPTIQQKLENRIQESSAFLMSIGLQLVDEMVGQKLGLGVSNTIAGRTNTDNNDRVPQHLGDLTGQGYHCKFTEFDTAIKYSKLDQWAKFKDFQTRIRDVIVRQQALDRIMIGFNGTSAAAETDRAANPLLQDVNIGWLEKWRTDAPERVMDEVAEASGEVTVGAGAGTNYKNLDALVFDAVNNFIATWHQERTDMVVVLGRQLLNDKYFPLINKDNAPTEHKALDLIVSEKRLGGLQAVRAPFVPAGTMLITPLENLAIYVQDGKRRRNIEENSKRSQIENYESSNEDYVVEDYSAGCLIENIVVN